MATPIEDPTALAHFAIAANELVNSLVKDGGFTKDEAIRFAAVYMAAATGTESKSD
jgi:polyhydroxyalkanoate synthesis regulator phasin